MDKCRARSKVYRQNNPEKEQARKSSWRQKNGKREKEYQKAYRQEHRDNEQARKRIWQQENKDKTTTQKCRRRARKVGAPGDITTKQIAARWEYYGGRCYICGNHAEATDHVIPLNKGGSNWPANLRPICKRCNSIKRDIWPYDFRAAKEAVMDGGA